MHVASHDLFNMKLRTCLDIGIITSIDSEQCDYMSSVAYDKGDSV
jgi:hypothetical protein